MKSPNSLIHSSSPYLLQHAWNPVQWYPWGPDALSKALKEDKMILVSIGYSACHWCHVMEHECFEDAAVADLMNKNFVCIKVDREERPDIDQVYMSAVQLMTGKGGWPLNCFTLPDGRPVYGGTYFPKAAWMNILQQLAEGYRADKAKFEDYGRQLTEGIRREDPVTAQLSGDDHFHELPESSVINWKRRFDGIDGGMNHAPKFPLPNNYLFLLHYANDTGDLSCREHVNLTLKKMAYGGIHDHIGGGFARYSVDGQWKVPHFEKMLYDNAQLISLYATSYLVERNPLYKNTASSIVEFVLEELNGGEGNYFSALDADSEGEEGKFYVWKKEEFMLLAGNDAELAAAYYNVNETGYWEHGNYILLRNRSDEELAEAFNLTPVDVADRIASINSRLKEHRSHRVRPGLDDKTLTSWNCLMVNGLLDAANAFQDEKYLKLAQETIQFLKAKVLVENRKLFHTYKNGKAAVDGFLEDYAFFIQALISDYNLTFNTSNLLLAKQLAEKVIEQFYDPDSGYFFFTAGDSEQLIARKYEIQDNVIPSSNSQMALNLYWLSRYFEVEEWRQMSVRMLNGVSEQAIRYGSAFSNWLTLSIAIRSEQVEIVICGKDAVQFRKQLTGIYYGPGVLFAGSEKAEELPLLEGRMAADETLIYLCRNKSCSLPLRDVPSLLKMLETDI